MPKGVYQRKPFSKEHKENMSRAWKGKMPKNIDLLHSKESQAKATLSRVGRPVSEETRGKISRANVGSVRPSVRGSNHYLWKEDRSLLKQSEKKHLDSRYRDWMRSIKVRDGWKCQIKNEDCRGRMEAHHILPWRDHPELRYEIKNGITLCQHHHPRKRAEEIRLSPYFQEIVNNIKL